MNLYQLFTAHYIYDILRQFTVCRPWTYFSDDFRDISVFLHQLSHFTRKYDNIRMDMRIICNSRLLFLHERRQKHFYFTNKLSPTHDSPSILNVFYFVYKHFLVSILYTRCELVNFPWFSFHLDVVRHFLNNFSLVHMLKLPWNTALYTRKWNILDGNKAIVLLNFTCNYIS